MVLAMTQWHLDRMSPCGTAAAYDRHVKRKEPKDDACRAANARRKREARATTGKARRQALLALAELHPAEYHALHAKALRYSRQQQAADPTRKARMLALRALAELFPDDLAQAHP